MQLMSVGNDLLSHYWCLIMGSFWSLATHAAVTRDRRGECHFQSSLMSWYPCDLQMGPLTFLVLVVPNWATDPSETANPAFRPRSHGRATPMLQAHKMLGIRQDSHS